MLSCSPFQPPTYQTLTVSSFSPLHCCHCLHHHIWKQSITMINFIFIVPFSLLCHHGWTHSINIKLWCTCVHSAATTHLPKPQKMITVPMCLSVPSLMNALNHTAEIKINHSGNNTMMLCFGVELINWGVGRYKWVVHMEKSWFCFPLLKRFLNHYPYECFVLVGIIAEYKLIWQWKLSPKIFCDDYVSDKIKFLVSRYHETCR